MSVTGPVCPQIRTFRDDPLAELSLRELLLVLAVLIAHPKLSAQKAIATLREAGM
jgi:hypothetical protein